MGLFMVFTLSFLTTRQTHPLAAFFHGNNKPQNVLFCFFVCLSVCLLFHYTVPSNVFIFLDSF